MKRSRFKKHIIDVLIGLGLVLIISPIVLYWFIHGNYERYIRIINGPFPFNSLGGGPFQIFVYSGLFIIGIVFIFIGFILRKKFR
jgi:hypothetical protein